MPTSPDGPNLGIERMGHPDGRPRSPNFAVYHSDLTVASGQAILLDTDFSGTVLGVIHVYGTLVFGSHHYLTIS